MNLIEKISYSPQICGARSKQGFTLIELLVVVLIIGILGAVALPQYQKITRKVKLQQYQLAAYKVRDALRLYQLTHGKIPQYIEDLDLWTSIKEPSNGGNHTGYVGNIPFLDNFHYYIRTENSLPGLGRFNCDIHWNGQSGFCYYGGNPELEKVFQSLGWEYYDNWNNGRYHIGKNWAKQ